MEFDEARLDWQNRDTWQPTKMHVRLTFLEEVLGTQQNPEAIATTDPFGSIGVAYPIPSQPHSCVANGSQV